MVGGDFDADTLRYKARERYSSGWLGLPQLWFDDSIYVENNGRTSWGSTGLTDTVRKEHWLEMERTNLW